MKAKIIPFPISSERKVKSLLGTIDFNELIQLRGDMIDRLFHMVDDGNEKAQSVLDEIGGKTVLEQVALLYQYYPYWDDWRKARKVTKN